MFKKTYGKKDFAVLLVSTVMILSAFSVVASLSGSSNIQQASEPVVYTPFMNSTYNGSSGQSNLSAELNSLVVLKAPGLSCYVNQINETGSFNYHDFMSSAEIGDTFGSPAYGQVVSFLKSQGLNVQTFSNNLVIYVSGTEGQFDSAFHTDLVQVQQNGTDYTLNTLPLSLPAALSTDIEGITGFDGETALPDLYHDTSITSAGVASPDGNFTSLASALYYKNGSYLWTKFPAPENNYQFLFPGTLPALTGAYNLWDGNSTIASEPDMGQGITIAVTEVGFISPGTMENFSQYLFHNPYQVTDRLTQVGIDIPSFQAGLIDAAQAGWTGETALDIEYIAAMDPDAHIDLVAVPNDQLASFDLAYAYIAQYLDTGSVQNLAGTPLEVFQGPNDQAAYSVSITSNSHSFYSTEVSYFAAPFDVLVQEELVNILALHGVTQFFATGDSGSNNGGTVLQASRPVEAAGVVSVGGGDLTAEDNGFEFPNTGIITNISGFTMTVARATGIGSYTYWSASGGLTGGTYAQSTIVSRPWWENALDTYATTGIIQPVVTNAAAFNMTLYDHGWQLFYGGTSFATPITAGEFGLIEQQVAYEGHSPMLGNANPLFFEAHNTFEAGLFSNDPYYPMQDIGVGWTWAPYNSYDWNYLNTTQEYPQYQQLPSWYSTLFNPAGNGWTFIGGLGLPLVDQLDSMLVGSSAGLNTIMNQPFYILMNSSGSLNPFNSLTGGTTYNFTILGHYGTKGGDYMVYAYSGGSNDGAYGGGQVTAINAVDGSFAYTPSYAPQPVDSNASEYGYFIVVPLGESQPFITWSFLQYGVDPPVMNGTLTIGIPTSTGMHTHIAEEEMFSDFNVQDQYNFGSLGVVTLNGQPVSGATVIQKSVSVAFDIEKEDPEVNSSQYAPGMTVGKYLTDDAGQFYLWNNPLVSANNGPVPTQIFQVYAEFQGKISNTVTVYVEPEAGTFEPYLHFNPSTSTVQGTVYFFGMKYLNYVNISSGSAPGQYANESFQPQSVASGFMDVNLSVPDNVQSVNISMAASGENTISMPFSFYLISTPAVSTGNPITWNYVTSVPESASYVSPSDSLFLNGTVFSSSVSLGVTGGYQNDGSFVLLSLHGPESIYLAGPVNSGSVLFSTTDLTSGYYTVNATLFSGNIAISETSGYVLVDKPLSNLNTEITELEAGISQLKSEIGPNSSQNKLGSKTVSDIKGQLSQDLVLLSEINTTYNQSAEIADSPGNYIAPSLQASSMETDVQISASLFSSYRTEIAGMARELAVVSAFVDGYHSVSVPLWQTILIYGSAASVMIFSSFVYFRRNKGKKEE